MPKNRHVVKFVSDKSGPFRSRNRVARISPNNWGRVQEAASMLKDHHVDMFISGKTWAAKWDCSLSTIRRAAARFGVRRVYAGSGQNGLVRYRLDDIEEIERAREVNPGQGDLLAAIGHEPPVEQTTAGRSPDSI